MSKPDSKRDYDHFLSGLSDLLESSRRSAVRVVNSVITATYWEMGRRIVEFEQKGERRAAYGEAILRRLSEDLTARFGKGFSLDNLELFRAFYLAYPSRPVSHDWSGKPESPVRILPAGKQNSESSIRDSRLSDFSGAFPLAWTHYVHLVRRVKSAEARIFYEKEAQRCGWSVRQLDRQITTQFFERAALSRDKVAMLRKSGRGLPEDRLTADEEIRDPLVLEFLNLKDEYSESDLEEALIRHLETFLMELGGDFAFVGRQQRLRLDDEWYRVDLVFFHRRLRCLVVIDLKVGKFTHADAGQMHLYLNYAREHWVRPEENPPVGLILCAHKGNEVAHYALDNLPNKILAREYRLLLPDEKKLARELVRSREQIEKSAGRNSREGRK
jgi:predicted nuclease of restriction endonuclease-like (RecB) superfamily